MNKSLLLFIFLFSSLLVNVKAQTGVDCATAVTASIGTNAGNGKGTQYFKFTATSTGYLKLYSSSTGYCYGYVYKENCDQLASQVVAGNCYKGNPLLLYVESGSTYYIKPLYMNSNSLIIEATNTIGKEIKSCNLDLASEYFYGKVDTVKNTIAFTVPDNADLTNVTYYTEWTNPTYTTLSANGSVLGYNGKINLTTLSSILITGKDGSTATYTVTVIKKSGISCSSSTVVSDTIIGSGELNQYYSFTPDVTSYYELITHKSSFNVTAYTGQCSSLTTLVDDYINSSQKAYLYGEAASTYYIRTYNQKTDSLIIKKGTHLPKEFTTVYVSKNSESYYASIDTVKNTLSIDLPSNLDLTSVNFTYYKTGHSYTTVSTEAGNITSGASMDISNISSLKITANDGSVATYTLTIKKVEGLSCESAKVITEDTTAGNGNSNQYYSYTSPTTKYIKIAPDKFSIYTYIYSGTCDNLTNLYSGYIDAAGPVELKVEAGIAYTIQIYDLDTNKLIIGDLTSIKKEFKSFEFDIMDNNYNAGIDTVKNTITVSVPSDTDLSSVDYGFSLYSNNLTSVSADGSELDSYGTADFSTVKSLLITADDGSVATYTLTINKVEGLSCSSAKVITENTTAGNGSYRQYFKYTSQTTKYIKIYPNKSNVYVNLYTGSCDELSGLFYGNAYAESPMELKVEAGTEYTLRVENLYSNSLIVSDLTSINKEISSFRFVRMNESYYGTIDTVKNTVTVPVPSDMDLTSVDYSFSLYGFNLTTVSAGGNLLGSSGTADFSTATSLLITADDGTTQTYSLVIKKTEGMSCSTAITANYGLTAGNGAYSNYFTFTPAETGFVSMYPSINSINLEIFSGTCDNLSNVYNSYAGVGSPSIIKFEGGKTYTIKANNLYSRGIVIKKTNSISKEFESFQFSDNFNYFYAKIDTIENSLTFTIPSELDLSKLEYYFNITSSEASVVSVNGKPISSYGSIDLTSSPDITITAIDGSSAVYTVNFVKDDNLNCASSTQLAEGTITGNGKAIQYYTYTPSRAGFIKFSSDDYLDIYLFKGECGSLEFVFEDDVEPGFELILPVEAGVKYTLLARDFGADKFTFAFLEKVSMDFSFFRLRDYDVNTTYLSEIDTVLNTVTVKVPAGCDKTRLLTDFRFVANQNITVTANDATFENDSYVDFTNISSLTLKGANNASVTYSLIFAETPGISCETATALTEGTTTGNGAYEQYFTFTASKSGYMNVSALDRYFYITVVEGTCGNLDSDYDYGVSINSPLVFKVEKDKQYIILANNLMDSRFNISYVNSVSKELTYAGILDGSAMYYGTIDSTAKTVSFIVPEGLDLSLVNYTFDLNDEINSHIVIGSDSVANYGIANFTNLTSLTIKGNDGTSVTYSVSFKTTNAVLYRVSASSDGNGIISPSGNMSVEKGTNLVFTITPKSGYAVKELYVDGAMVTPASTYTFTDVSDEHYIDVTFEKLTGVKSTFGDQVRVYPNPFKNNLTVEAESGTLLTVYNAQGARILENVMDSNIKAINLSGYPQGLYIIEIRQGEKVERYKAVKQ